MKKVLEKNMAIMVVLAGLPTAVLFSSHNRFTYVLYSFCTIFYIIFIDFYIYLLCMYYALCAE